MTAKMIYTKRGGSFLCTGVLMLDLDDSSWIPYFLTAHHCIATQAAAQTLVTYWDFERASCGGPAPTTVTQLTGGADLLITHSGSDSSLLRLRRDPPAGRDGRWYAGWTAATLRHPTSVYGVHHPAGDLKKYSAGTTVRDVGALLGDEEGGYLQEVKGVDVRWSSGVTESGSSGSGLFDTTGRLRGVLSGSPAGETCSTSSFYGRFDRFFPYARPWLTAGAPSPRDDHGDTGDQATSVALGSSTQGHLERQGDRDYFRFSLSEPGTLTVYTTGATDTYGHLLLGNGQWLEENDDGGTFLNFRIERLVPAGAYSILVRGYDDRSTGRYTLVVRFAPKGGRGSGSSLNDLLGTWRFTYTILSTWTDIYRLSRIDTSTGTPLIVGTDQYGGPVAGGRIQDISPGNSLPYEFALLDPSIIICQFFLFDKTGTNRVEGVYIQIDDGECDGDASNPYPMIGTRTSRATSGIQEQSLTRDAVLEQLSAELQSFEEATTLDLPSPDEADSAAIRDIIDTLSPALD